MKDFYFSMLLFFFISTILIGLADQPSVWYTSVSCVGMLSALWGLKNA